MEDLTGMQFGQYRLVAPLGQGGMAIVYRAYQASMDRYVAIKILPRHYAAEPGFIARFEQEARLIARLEHPHILPVHDFGKEDDYTYLVMRFVDGGSLSQILKGKPAPFPLLIKVISQIGDALDYAHSRGVIHRDVKPGNILIDERSNCQLTDFGIAKMVESSAYFTKTGTFIGTPAYMSPEQARGEPLDGRSDLYSLGIVLYEMATGSVPFDAETPVAAAIKHLHDPLPLPRRRNPALPEGMERVILKALDKNRESRYRTAGDLAADLGRELSRSTPGPATVLDETWIEPGDVPADTIVEDYSAAPAAETATVAEPSTGRPGTARGREESAPAAQPGAPERTRAPRRKISTLLITGLIGVLVVGMCLVGLSLFLPRGLAGLIARSAGTPASPTMTLDSAAPAGSEEPQVLGGALSINAADRPIFATPQPGSEPATTATGSAPELVPISTQNLASLQLLFQYLLVDDVYLRDLLPLSDGELLAAKAYDSQGIYLSSMDPQELPLIIRVVGEEVIDQLDLSPNGELLAAISSTFSGDVYIIDVRTGQLLFGLPDQFQQDQTGGSDCGYPLAWSPDGALLAIGKNNGEIEVYDVAGQQLRFTLGNNSEPVCSLAWAPDGQLASGSMNNTIIIWDVENQRQARLLEGHSADVTRLSWSPDGVRLASAGFQWDNMEDGIRVWNVDAGEVEASFGQEGWFSHLSWSPDGSLLAYSDYSVRTYLWDAVSGTTVEGIELFGRASRWSPDGRRLFLYNDTPDCKIEVWGIPEN